MSASNIAALAGAAFMVIIGVLFFSGVIKPPSPSSVQTATATNQ